MATGGTVDFRAGHLLVSVDDFYGLIGQPGNLVLMPRLNLNLAAGNYSMLIDTCCTSWFKAIQDGGVAAGNDGTNTGDYIYGGSSTLASTTAYLDGLETPDNPGKDWAMEVTGDVGGRASVPEPASVLLFGLAFAGMLAGRSRIARR